jgi:hypothetical protein
MFDEHYRLRNQLVDALVRDLVGPQGPLDAEIISDPPITRYVAGILYPQTEDVVDPFQDQDPADEYDETAAADPPVAMANVRYPSSFGLTFAVDLARTRRIQIRATASRYMPLPPEGGEPPARRQRGTVQTGERWERVPVEIEPVVLEVGAPHPAIRHRVAPGLDIFCRVRTTDAWGIAPVTVVMLNTNKIGPTGGMRDAEAFFQPALAVTASDSHLPPFAARPAHVSFADDEDLESYRLLYRHALAFATGHGCSVEWETTPGETYASSISTTFTPRFDLLLADSNPAIETDALGLRVLVTSPRREVLERLKEFVAGYERWLATLRSAAATLPDHLRRTAEAHLKAIDTVSQRMRAGIAVLEDQANPQAWDSFVLMNRAMLQLRARSDWLHKGKPDGGPDEGQEHRWRPFQLAFILLCLPGIIDPSSKDRGIADLLWFPTGGGKTEAYFGLIAFTVFHRRLCFPGMGAGVTVLMRYTLRLLTIQQFERASLLICCCEHIRRSRNDLGVDEVSIGLWVGAAGTPNTLDDARKSLDRLRANEERQLEEKNPVQLHACPWCGIRLDHRNYHIANDPRRLVVACRQKDCDFAAGLPVHVVDEDIYRSHPTLVIATADKYASLPWSEEVAQLFNLISVGLRRPELIIQDELHLISGPLGTLAGLYETAIDALCTQDGLRPKVVASTATIRRAAQQSSGLFDRPVRQFPPPGLDARDSYFAVESPRDRRGTRLYVGLMAPGTSQTTLLVRSYAALLQNVSTLPGTEAVKDAYWTLVGYFNSLRVLGGARMQVQDDVGDRLELLAEEAGSESRPIENRIELTSREPSGAIPSHLKRMAVSRPDVEALDVILATNMISVGVDIDRLGLMVMMGQPQSTSEYIQATSRVGRRWPGLVVVLFNAARSRDRSHYESFVAYHSALYRQVESTSVTPFSSRSRDRALHAVVIALARLLVPGFRSNRSARRILTHRSDLDVVKDVVVRRVEAVSPEDRTATEAEVDRVLDEWEERARECPDLFYTSPSHPERALLTEAGIVGDADIDGFPTLRSLRDVDRSSNLYLVWG